MKMIKQILLSLLLVNIVAIITSCNKTPINIISDKVYNQGIKITPTPLELNQKEGFFDLNKNTSFYINDKSLKEVTELFINKIEKSTGYKLNIKSTEESNNSISIILDKTIAVNDEGYLLHVNPKDITIIATTTQGAFYGMQTLLQLLPAEIESSIIINNTNWKIPCVEIKDEPRFKYRGQHFDPCRHFADVDYIKKHLDILSMYKINKFHWHLTEDQGWRIEIKKYPKLTQIGAKRVEGDSSTYGPYFYTQEQIKEIVAYAKERFIEVIPEIELPGHGVAALAAYPEYSCTGGPFEVRNIWGVSNDVYCAGNDSTFQFLTDVIEEVIPLFDSEYFHIGGDECPKDRWKNCPKCQARIKELGIKGDKTHSAEEKLQSYFVQRMEKVLLKHNKKMIGWDEILEGGLAPSATVMSWRGEQGGIAAANMGHDVIMTPGGWLYLDHYQGDPNNEPVSIGGYTTLEKTYSYEPIPEKIEESRRHHILGAQGNVWSEYIYNDSIRELRTYPRIIALAEVTWSAKEKRNYYDFEKRLDNQLVRLDMHNVNYYIPQPEQADYPSSNSVAFIDTATLKFKVTRPLKIVYTIDGSLPTPNSMTYDTTNYLSFTDNTILKIAAVLSSGKMSPTRTIHITQQQFNPAINQSEIKFDNRLKAEYYKGYTREVIQLDNKDPDDVEYISSPQKSKHMIPNAREIKPDEFYSTIITGYINIPNDDIYYFNTSSEFWIDNKLLITNNTGNDTARRFSRNTQSIALAKGLHAIKIVRLGAIFGGWPTQWENVTVSMRAKDEKTFKILDDKYFSNN